MISISSGQSETSAGDCGTSFCSETCCRSETSGSDFCCDFCCNFCFSYSLSFHCHYETSDCPSSTWSWLLSLASLTWTWYEFYLPLHLHLHRHPQPRRSSLAQGSGSQVWLDWEKPSPDWTSAGPAVWSGCLCKIVKSNSSAVGCHVIISVDEIQHKYYDCFPSPLCSQQRHMYWLAGMVTDRPGLEM